LIDGDMMGDYDDGMRGDGDGGDGVMSDEGMKDNKIMRDNEG
jgi:hypothetical protein